MPPAPEGSFDHLIVVGASAGGVEALSRFVGALPTDLSAPVVIAQHLDPQRPSHLAEILTRQSPLTVCSVESHEPLVPGTVFVVPSNRHVTITDHHVDVHPDATRRPTPSVDLLLVTAAATFGERLIAVVLTGGDADGSDGVRAVRREGGRVIAQDEATSEVYGMPESAIGTGCVDFVLPLSEIGPKLEQLVAGDSPRS